MIKHIGRHDEKKVVVLYRTVPQQENMCLLVYSDLLPRTYHDAVMRLVESEAGQQAAEFSDALFRNLLPDGRNILETLHREGLIRKIPTSQVIITPDTKNSCRLDELNSMLAKIAGGEGAKLAETDATRGLRDPMRQKELRTTSGDVTGEVPPAPLPASIPPNLAATLATPIAAQAPVAPVVQLSEDTIPEVMAKMEETIAEGKRLERRLKELAKKIKV